MEVFRQWLESLVPQPEKIGVTFALSTQVTIGSAKVQGELLDDLRQFEADHPGVKILNENGILTGPAYDTLVDFAATIR